MFFPLVRYLGTKVDSMTPRINKGHKFGIQLPILF